MTDTANFSNLKRRSRKMETEDTESGKNKKICNGEGIKNQKGSPSDKRRKETMTNGTNLTSNSVNHQTITTQVSHSRRKSKPVKLEHISNIRHGCTPEELLKFYTQKGIPQPYFLIRNLNKRSPQTGTVQQYLEKTDSKIEDVMPKIERMIQQQTDQISICSVELTKILGWATAAETAKEHTSTSLVESYMAFVEKDGNVILVENGKSIVPLSAEKQSHDYVAKAQFNTKKLKYIKFFEKKAKAMYLVMVAKRFTVKIGKEARRRTRGVMTEADPENLEYTVQTRYGCRILLNNERKKDFTDAKLHIILVENDESKYKFLPKDSEYTEDREGQIGWMKTASNLEALDVLNKRNDNSHLVRAFIVTQKNVPYNPPRRAVNPPQTIVNSVVYFCPLRPLVSFKTLPELVDNVRKRFQFFECCITEDSLSLRPRKSYFGDGTSFKKNDYVWWRTRGNRGHELLSHTLLKNSRDNAQEKRVPAARNHVPEGNAKKFGLDYVQTNTSSVLSTVYHSRKNDILPKLSNDNIPDDEGSRESSDPVRDDETDQKKRGKKKKPVSMSNEHYPENNAKMFTDYILHEQEYSKLEKLVQPDQEMQVVERMPTREETVSFNRKLAASYEDCRKNGISDVLSRPPNPEIVDEVGVDFEGRKIPVFLEIFFPYGKIQMYNMLYRHFLAEAGIRPGAITAVHKVRTMIGFLDKNWKELLDNGLSPIYQKHLDMMMLNSPGFTFDHLKMVMDKLKEHKRQWRRNRKTAESSSDVVLQN